MVLEKAVLEKAVLEKAILQGLEKAILHLHHLLRQDIGWRVS